SFSPRAVLTVESVEHALRALDQSARIAVLVSNYDLRDGTARKLFLLAIKRSPWVRRVLYGDTQRLLSPHAKPAIKLAHAVANDFAELRRVVDEQSRITDLGERP